MIGAGVDVVTLAVRGRGAPPAPPAPIAVDLTLTTGEWGGVDLMDLLPSSIGWATFAVTTGTLPAGIALDANSGMMSGVTLDPAINTTVTVTATAVSGGSTRDFTVSITSTQGYTSNDGTSYLSTATVMGADGGRFTFACRLRNSRANHAIAAQRTIFMVTGRHHIYWTSAGRLRVELGQVSPGAVGSAFEWVSDDADYTSEGEQVVVVSVDATADPVVLNVTIDGVAVPGAVVSGSLVGPFTFDHTRTGYSLYAQASGGTPLAAGAGLGWAFVSFGETIAPSAFGTVSAPVNPATVGSPEILVIGSQQDFNDAAGINLGTGAALVRSAATFTGPDERPMAFPDAVGFGRFATGGRGLTLYSVTNTNTSGAGSLAAALTAAETGGGYIRIEAEGAIELTDELPILGDDVTIDARRAPGLGMWNQNARLRVGASNVILTGWQGFAGLRRQPDGQGYFARDSISIGPNGANIAISDVYVDRCTAMWGSDETMSITSIDTPAVARVTFDRCIVAEAMKQAIPAYGSGDSYTEQGTGAVLFVVSADSADGVTIARSLITGGDARHPQVAVGNPGVEIVNNVVANWGANGTQIGGTGVTASLTDILGNVYAAGPNSNEPDTRQAIAVPDVETTTEEVVYLEDNRFGTLASGALVESGVISSVRNKSNAAMDAAALDNPALFGKSGIVPAASSTVLADVLAKAGAYRLNGELHPFAQRVKRYLTAATPFQAADGWNGMSGGELPQPTALAAVGVTVTPGAGQIAVTFPATSMQAATGRAWTGATVRATLLDANMVETATVTDQTASGDPSGNTITVTGLSAGDYTIRVTWHAGSVDVPIHDGIAWTVT